MGKGAGGERMIDTLLTTLGKELAFVLFLVAALGLKTDSAFRYQICRIEASFVSTIGFIVSGRLVF